MDRNVTEIIFDGAWQS